MASFKQLKVKVKESKDLTPSRHLYGTGFVVFTPGIVSLHGCPASTNRSLQPAPEGNGQSQFNTNTRSLAICPTTSHLGPVS